MTNDSSTPSTSKAKTEAEIAAYTIGERKPHNDSILLAEYDPSWPAMFEREEQRIRRALGDGVVQLEHVGSTSVPGLAAKPRIDILLAVQDSSDESSYVPALESAGYVLRIREPGWHEHRLFKRPDMDLNVHVFTSGCVEIDRMVRFRDWLRTHVEDRELYERTKRDLSEVEVHSELRRRQDSGRRADPRSRANRAARTLIARSTTEAGSGREASHRAQTSGRAALSLNTAM